MALLRVGIKYCGNCNPTIDGPALVKKLREIMSETEFLPYEHPCKDVLLVVSACSADCATRPQPPGPEVVVAGRSVNFISCEENTLPAAVRSALEHYRIGV